MKYIGNNGKFYTRQLFWEEWVELPNDQQVFDPPFTLHKDKPGRINFGTAYVASRDPTGYKVSQQLLGSYSHWQALLSCRWFNAAKEIWDKELDAAIQSEAMDEIKTLMKEGLPAQKLAAAKYLANKDYRKDNTASKGRPRREDINRAAKDMAATEREVLDDLARIRGNK